MSTATAATLGSFRKSSYTMHAPVQNCVEVGSPGPVAVRDTKQAHMGDARTTLEFSAGAFARFTAQLR